MRNFMRWAAVPALALMLASPAFAADKPHVKNVVLVHGAWADGSGWEGVYRLLVAKGYTVSVVSNSDESLAGDVAATKRVLDRQDGPVILVGHSYGGAIITEAGNDPKVVGLVYIAAFAPDVPRAEAEFMADSQVPLGIEKAGSAPITTAAWKTKPSWYLVSSNDQIIPPAAQRQMAGRAKSTVQEVAGSHVAFISHPDAAAAIIEQAAEAMVK